PQRTQASYIFTVIAILRTPSSPKRVREFSLPQPRLKTLRLAEQDQTRPATLDEIDALIAGSPSPHFVATCRSFRDQFQQGDEVLEFCTSRASWGAMAGRAGYLLRRD